jgi:hemerythrin superfamily protein
MAQVVEAVSDALKGQRTRSEAVARPEGEPQDAIALIEQQHREVEQLFARFEDAQDREARRLFLQIADLLTLHAIAEERHFYPTLRERRTEDILESLLTEHLTMKSILRALLDMDMDDPEFDAQLDALRIEIFHHVEDEETHLLPKVPRVLHRSELVEIGRRMRETQDELSREGEPRNQLEVEVEPPQPMA